jgi:pimeloyl-ACP methyl ester carboxylesterase
MIDSNLPRPPTRPTRAPWEFAAPWGARGYITPLDGPVHWIEFTPRIQIKANQARTESTEPPIVFVHGLGGSHLNWCLIGPQLAAGRRAVALDLHGFGLTPGTRRNSTVQANTRLLDRFVREVVGTPVILVGNSMGGLISLLQTAAAPDTVAKAGADRSRPAAAPAEARLAGGQPVPAVRHPGLGELYLAKTPVTPDARRKKAVQRVIDLCFADPSRADPAMVTAAIALAVERQAARTGTDLPGGGPVPDAGGRPPAPLLRDDGRGGSRCCSSAVPPTGWCRWRPSARPRPAIPLGKRYPPRGRAYAAARGARRQVLGVLHRLAGPALSPATARTGATRMQQLTGLDASFLALETATTTGHVGGLCVLDPSGAPRPLTLARLTEVLAERIPLVPVLRRKLLQVPLGLDQPYWIDDAGLRHRVPRPRGRAAAARIGRAADRAGQPAARPAAGPQPPAVGDLPDHRAGQGGAPRSTPRSTTPRSTVRPAPSY